MFEFAMKFECRYSNSSTGSSIFHNRIRKQPVGVISNGTKTGQMNEVWMDEITTILDSFEI